MGGEEDLPEVVDLSDVQATSYEPIPRGIYDAVIEDVEYVLSQSKSLPQLIIICRFEYDADDGQGPKDRTLRYYAGLSGDGAGRTKALIAELDPELDLATLKPDDLADRWGGMGVRIQVTIRPDRDDRSIKRNNIGRIMPADDFDQ